MKHVMIGVGAAGMTAAKTIKSLRGEDEIVMISTDDFVHSRCMLHKYLSHERTEAELNFVPQDFFSDNEIVWMKGRTVTQIDTEKKTVYLHTGETAAFDRLLIATGADSFIPPVGQFREAVNVFGLRNLSDAQQISRLAEKKEKILIVGSGLVGMDAAYAFLARGKEVTIVEMAERILPIQLDETAGNAYRELFEKHGCKFLLGRKACETQMNAANEIRKVILDDGTEVICDLIIAAAGVRAATACVQESTIEADRFIRVDSCMRTNSPDIYAAGDVTGLSGIWPNAMKQGQTAAYNMCGIQMQYQDTYAMKNTINFYGLVTMSLGQGLEKEGDLIISQEDQKSYKKAIIRDGLLDSILLQGDIDYSGIYQYIIKNKIDISAYQDCIFTLSFADFYATEKDGQYSWKEKYTIMDY